MVGHTQFMNWTFQYCKGVNHSQTDFLFKAIPACQQIYTCIDINDKKDTTQQYVKDSLFNTKYWAK